MRQLWRESKQISVWREKQLVMEKFSEILQPHVHSRCLPTLQIPERALFARFNVSFKRGEHYRNWSINPLPLTGVLWIANSCWFHVEVLGTTCHKSSVVHKSQSPRVLLTEQSTQIQESSFYTNPARSLHPQIRSLPCRRMSGRLAKGFTRFFYRETRRELRFQYISPLVYSSKAAPP